MALSFTRKSGSAIDCMRIAFTSGSCRSRNFVNSPTRTFGSASLRPSFTSLMIVKGVSCAGCPAVSSTPGRT